MFLATARTVSSASGSKPGPVKHVERAGTYHSLMFASTSFSSPVSLPFLMLLSLQGYL
jgi:hypothetical protein